MVRLRYQAKFDKLLIFDSYDEQVFDFTKGKAEEEKIMKRKGLFKRSLAFLLTSVMTIGLVSYMPNDVTKVQAEETKSKSTIMLGCLLHNKNTESCKRKMEKVASPFWRMLQPFQNGFI